jgi:chemotaxis signal transduction protein
MSKNQKTDWQAVRRKLDENAHLLQSAFDPSREVIDDILAARAQHLARRQGQGAEYTARRTVLLIEVGGSTAGIEIQWIQEVVNLAQNFTPVPDADEVLLGVVNVHNQLVNLINPGPLLNEELPAGSGAFSQAVMLRHPQLRVAIGCSQVVDLVDLAEDAWQSERLFFFHPDRSPGVLLDIHALLQRWEKQA